MTGRDQATHTSTPDWHGLPGWRVLDTHFEHGQAFFSTWQQWLEDAERPQTLHYVALCQEPVSSDTLTCSCGSDTHLKPLAQELADLWFGLLPGFHRFLLAQGRVVLTLCIGDTLSLLRQQQFQADAIALGGAAVSSDNPAEAESLWLVKALARCCRRGTTLTLRNATPASMTALPHHLKQCGFAISDEATPPPAPGSNRLEARFDPPWALRSSRQSELPTALPIQRCAVIGAGLAGASVAASLARRGWQVTVLDQAATPAAGASGLPVGMVVPHISSDDCALSRLSRAGVRLMLQQARQHLQEGQQWSACGVLEREVGGTRRLPASWPAAGHEWSTESVNAAVPPQAEALGRGIWHQRGAWLKPAELIHAWLSQPGVVFQGNAKVTGLRRHDNVWDLLDQSGRVLCSAERVVFANAAGATPLLKTLQPDNTDLAKRLQHLPAMQGMRGLLNWAMQTDVASDNPVFPPFPVNGSGSVVANVPHEGGSAWFMGSSYQPDHQPERSDRDNQFRNFEHLQRLLPALAAALEPAFASNQLKTWKNTRCVTVDRLPAVGPLDGGPTPSLWICAGIGSRGLSFSVLCAELLAARMGAEPLPVEANLAKSLYALRA